MTPSQISSMMSGMAGAGAAGPAYSGAGPNNSSVYIEAMRINQPAFTTWLLVAGFGFIAWQALKK